MEKKCTLVYFNTQTTGLNKPSICELAAEVDATGYLPFHKYILPTKQVGQQATDKNKFQLSPDGTQLLLKGEIMNTCNLKDALNEFLTWLQAIQKPVLVDHYVSYHIKALNRAFANYPSLGQQFDEVVMGTVDTLELFKMIYPPGTPLTREALVRDVLGDVSYNKYTAPDHVRVLRQLIEKKGITKVAILKRIEAKPDTPKIPLDPILSSETMNFVTSPPSLKRKLSNKDELGKNGKKIKRKRREPEEESYKIEKPRSPLESKISGVTLPKSKKMDRKKQGRTSKDKKDKQRKKVDR